jgi:hypothetical protein
MNDCVRQSWRISGNITPIGWRIYVPGRLRGAVLVARLGINVGINDRI